MTLDGLEFFYVIGTLTDQVTITQVKPNCSGDWIKVTYMEGWGGEMTIHYSPQIDAPTVISLVTQALRVIQDETFRASLIEEAKARTIDDL